MDVASLQTYMADIDNLALVASIDNMCFFMADMANGSYDYVDTFTF